MDTHSTFLVLHPYFLSRYQGIANQAVTVQISAVQTDAGDLTVFIGGVVVDTLMGVAAGGIEGEFVFVITDPDQSTLLGDTAENVEELADCGIFILITARIEFGEHSAYKS